MYVCKEGRGKSVFMPVSADSLEPSPLADLINANILGTGPTVYFLLFTVSVGK